MPLVAYVGRAAKLAKQSQSVIFMNAVLLTSGALFALGCVKAMFIETDVWWQAGLRVLLYGEFTASVAYCIGWAIDRIVDVTMEEQGQAGEDGGRESAKEPLEAKPTTAAAVHKETPAADADPPAKGGARKRKGTQS